jgi:hypothetical protein
MAPPVVAAADRGGEQPDSAFAVLAEPMVGGSPRDVHEAVEARLFDVGAAGGEGGVVFALVGAVAAGVEPSSLYDLTFHATNPVARGASGSVTARIVPHAGAHLSDEAPVTLTLSATPAIALSKSKATRADVKYAGGGGVLEVPFTAVEAGQATIEAKLRFYICTDKTCAQQEKTTSLPVTVR